jgi:[acyl-carrier-protein] S-malonyltransferase
MSKNGFCTRINFKKVKVKQMEKIAFLFPGQGSQYIGMSKTLYNQYDIARYTFEEASDTLGFDVAKLCFESSLADLGKTENALIAILTASVVAFRVYMKEIGIIPQCCAGHSLGEYSALTCSGAIRFSDALKIVFERSKIAQQVAEKVDGMMTIIDGLTAETIANFCSRVSKEDNFVAISCYNSGNQVAISGHSKAVQEVEDLVLKQGGQVTPLISNPPFHSPIMQHVVEKLKNELSKYSFHHLRYPVISNVTALPYEGQDQIIDTLINHMIRPVKWLSILNYLEKRGITLTIEMGPKSVLSDLVKLNIEHIKTACFDQKEDRKDLIELKKGYTKFIPTIVTKCLAIAVSTPNTNFSNEEYQNGVILSFQRIREIQNEIEKKGTIPDMDEMTEALKLLQVIMETKKVSPDEQLEWYDEIFEETGTSNLFSNFLINV